MVLKAQSRSKDPVESDKELSWSLTLLSIDPSSHKALKLSSDFDKFEVLPKVGYLCVVAATLFPNFLNFGPSF